MGGAARVWWEAALRCAAPPPLSSLYRGLLGLGAPALDLGGLAPKLGFWGASPWALLGPAGCPSGPLGGAQPKWLQHPLWSMWAPYIRWVPLLDSTRTFRNLPVPC